MAKQAAGLIAAAAIMLTGSGTVTPRERKGYWIVANDVVDRQAHEGYIVASQAVIARCGGVYLVRGGQQQLVEGNARARHVVIEFKNYAAALACHESADYQRAKLLRAGATIGDTVIVEGADPAP